MEATIVWISNYGSAKYLSCHGFEVVAGFGFTKVGNRGW